MVARIREIAHCAVNKEGGTGVALSIMAIAPWYEQAKLLYAATRKAALFLKRPIDRIEVTAGKVLFWADTKVVFWTRTKKLAISYRYVPSQSPYPGASPQLLLDGEEPARFDAAPQAGHAALPPWREREELLYASISKATLVLQASIDRIEVTPDKVLLRAGSKELAISYQFVKNPKGWLKPRGFLLDGEDH
jgi:hypothetical protein